MDPRTGEILALANWPSFNPNAYRDSRPEAQRNRAIQDLYEPGSTFKIVTASAAFEEKVVDPDDQIDVSAGNIRFGARVIDDDHNYGVLSFTDVIVKSSNVGAIKVGLKLGPERLGLYMKRFGFGRRTSPDFPGESAGIMWDPAKLTDSALASVSMGYQVGVTPLQMAAAVSSIANGGELFEPRIVRAVIARRHAHAGAAQGRPPHRVAGHRGDADRRSWKRSSNRGTGTRAQIPGFTVAGKTGTAQKVVNGQYSRSDYNASFVGFVPSRDPAFAIVVVIDSPHGRNLLLRRVGRRADLPAHRRRGAAASGRSRRRSIRRRRCSWRDATRRASGRPRDRRRLPAIVTLAGSVDRIDRVVSGSSRPRRPRCAAHAGAARADGATARARASSSNRSRRRAARSSAASVATLRLDRDIDADVPAPRHGRAMTAGP